MNTKEELKDREFKDLVGVTHPNGSYTWFLFNKDSL